MKKILIEASSIAQEQKTGVGYFSQQLSGAIETAAYTRNTVVWYLWLNPLGRKIPRSNILLGAQKDGRLIQIRTMAQRVYAKLIYWNVAFPIISPFADWIIFPNFYLWPMIGPKKKAVVIHDVCFARHPEYVEDKNQRFLSRVALRAIKKADLIITMSNFTKNEIIALTKIQQEKIFTIDIPVDIDELLPEKNLGPSRLRARYGIQKAYILTLGTIEPRKNITLLVEAYVRLPTELRKKYSLVIAGKWGWKTDSIKKLITRYQSNGYDIITTSYIDSEDKSTLYRNASAYAISTFYEGFGMPLLEAFHCGLPTVATDIPVLREVAGDGTCLWSSFDVDDYSKKLEIILTDKDLALTLRKGAVKQSESYSWEKTATKLLQKLS